MDDVRPTPPAELACDVTQVLASAGGARIRFGTRAGGPLLQIDLSPATARHLRDTLARALQVPPPAGPGSP